MSYDSLGETRLGQLRAEEADMKESIVTAIKKVTARRENLDELGERTALWNPDMFQRTATRLKRKLWWQTWKLWLILIIIILIILAIIAGIVVVVVETTKKK